MNPTQLILKKLRIDLIADQHTLLRVLYFLEFTPGFVLTGSRFFGTDNKGSDYDFFIDENAVDLQALRDLGFVSDWNSGYSDSDPSVRTVYVFTSGNFQIHVQVIKNYYYNNKVVAQEKIWELFRVVPEIMTQMNKESMKKVWRRYMYMQ